MPHAFFHTTASIEEGNMAKRQKLEPMFEEVLEPSQLSGKAKVHYVVSRRARVIIASTARSLVERRPCVSSVARRLLLSMPNVRQRSARSLHAPGKPSAA